MANIYNWQEFVTMSRSKMKQKVPYKTSIPFGKVVPIGGVPFDVLPHTTVKLDLANVTRMLTPVSPIMDDISMDVYSFFCPWRILFDKTKNFFGENDLVAWTLVENVTLPQIFIYTNDLDAVWTDDSDEFNSGNYLYLCTSKTVGGNKIPTGLLKSVFAGSLFDYFGLPWVYPNMDIIQQMSALWVSNPSKLDETLTFQAMPFRGVQAIFNEFFRNENVTDPILDLFYDSNDVGLDAVSFITMYKNHDNENPDNLTYNFWYLPSVARYRDLFTTLNPAPQRGPSVALPLSQSEAPLKTQSSTYEFGGSDPLMFYTENTHLSTGLNRYLAIRGKPASGGSSYHDGKVFTNEDSNNNLSWNVDDEITGSNLKVDLSQVTMATVNQIRYAFATQRYYEKLARGGARYHEYLRVMFGVRPADAVLQRPQYLGGHHEHINVQQVLQTSETSSTPLGSTGAYSVTGFKSHTFTNSFSEFGIILTFATIRKQHTYCQGLDKYWTKRDVFDIYNPTFAHIGEVPVMKNEVYWQPGNDDVLGYNEAWYEYREISPAKVTGLLNPLAPNNLSTFVLTDVYDEAPTLSDKFIFEDPNGLDRVLVAGASYTNQFICDFLFEYTFSVVMPVHSTPGLIDHY